MEVVAFGITDERYAVRAVWRDVRCQYAWRRGASATSCRRRAVRIEPETAERIRVSERSHNRVPCPPVWVTSRDHWALDDAADGVVQLPERLVLARAEAFSVRVCRVSRDRAVGGIVTASDVPTRELGAGENGGLYNAAAAVPDEGLKYLQSTRFAL